MQGNFYSGGGGGGSGVTQLNPVYTRLSSGDIIRHLLYGTLCNFFFINFFVVVPIKFNLTGCS